MLDFPHYFVSRAALQNALRISWTTLERWIRIYGCPVEKSGGQGEAWEFHLPEVVLFAAQRRLINRAHKINVPCQDCGTWVHSIIAGSRNPYSIFCEPCRAIRNGSLDDL